MLAAHSTSCLLPVSGPSAVLLGQTQRTSLECTPQPATAATLLTSDTSQRGLVWSPCYATAAASSPGVWMPKVQVFSLRVLRCYVV